MCQKCILYGEERVTRTMEVCDIDHRNGCFRPLLDELRGIMVGADVRKYGNTHFTQACQMLRHHAVWGFGMRRAKSQLLSEQGADPQKRLDELLGDVCKREIAEMRMDPLMPLGSRKRQRIEARVVRC